MEVDEIIKIIDPDIVKSEVWLEEIPEEQLMGGVSRPKRQLSSGQPVTWSQRQSARY